MPYHYNTRMHEIAIVLAHVAQLNDLHEKKLHLETFIFQEENILDGVPRSHALDIAKQSLRKIEKALDELGIPAEEPPLLNLDIAAEAVPPENIAPLVFNTPEQPPPEYPFPAPMPIAPEALMENYEENVIEQARDEQAQPIIPRFVIPPEPTFHLGQLGPHVLTIPDDENT